MHVRHFALILPLTLTLPLTWPPNSPQRPCQCPCPMPAPLLLTPATVFITLIQQRLVYGLMDGWNMCWEGGATRFLQRFLS